MEMAVHCAQWPLCSIKQIIATTRSETQELPSVYRRDKEDVMDRGMEVKMKREHDEQGEVRELLK